MPFKPVPLAVRGHVGVLLPSPHYTTKLWGAGRLYVNVMAQNLKCFLTSQLIGTWCSYMLFSNPLFARLVYVLIITLHLTTDKAWICNASISHMIDKGGEVSHNISQNTE